MFYVNFTFILFIIYNLLMLYYANALIATEDYIPHGTNPLLYYVHTDKIIQLDQSTFKDTIFQANKSFAFVINYYADWFILFYFF